jgi:hypothetical protein
VEPEDDWIISAEQMVEMLAEQESNRSYE